MFKDKNLAEYWTSVAENLKKVGPRGVCGVRFFQLSVIWGNVFFLVNILENQHNYEAFKVTHLHCTDSLLFEL